MTHPRTLQLIMDSLRYWIQEMHVDGFRFDLASALARELNDVDRLGSFFDIIHQDPVISQVKLIAEPWDLGEGGYQVGNFPNQWAEWNGIYRDTVRAFVKGDEGQAGGMGHRLTGSSDLYGRGGRRPYASINFVTAHDGFTLHDLVSYNDKHNEANGEDNRDGSDHNISWNHGVEGPTDDVKIIALRERQKRNFLATLLLSQGVPMLCGGDEIGRTQQGNNNAYCQDTVISWLDWSLDDLRNDLLTFTRFLAELRREHPVFRRRQFFFGRKFQGSEVKDLTWFRCDGGEMTQDDWTNPITRCFGLRLAGDAIQEPDVMGRRIVDDTFLVMLNAHHEPMGFTLPAHRNDIRWEPVLDTREPTGQRKAEALSGGDVYDMEARSVVMLRLRRDDEGGEGEGRDGHDATHRDAASAPR
jgi:glycogen operon protein